MSSPLTRRLVRALVRKSRQLALEWRRGAVFMKPHEEIAMYGTQKLSVIENVLPQSCQHELHVDSLMDSSLPKQLSSFVVDRFRQNPMSPEAHSDAFAAIRAVSERIGVLEKMKYVPHSEAVSGDISVTVQSQCVKGAGPLTCLYHITLKNSSHERSHCLLRRSWHVLDGTGARFDVSGEGVLGVMPVLAPGASYSYESFVPLAAQSCTYGTMWGTYEFQEVESGRVWEATIAPFGLLPPLLPSTPES